MTPDGQAPRLAAIGARGARLAAASDAELRDLSSRLRERARSGIALDDLLVEAFALAQEASARSLGLRPFDEQLLGALAMHGGAIAEMQTGEGKTLAAVMPVYLAALAGRGAHVLTANDYLARRDARWMGGIYELLGLRVGHVQQGMGGGERRSAYAADVTYACANELGFDYLRDALCFRPEDRVQRELHFGLVDEADSILIDEARIPLVVAGGVVAPEAIAHRAAELVRSLASGIDHRRDEHDRNVHLTDAGAFKVEAALGCGNLYDAQNLGLLTAVNLALHAEVLLRRDVDYLVRGDAVELVDELKGRVAERRRWPDGLQAAIEAKERVPLTRQGRVLGSIAFQNLVRLYGRLCGMTGTARTQAEELREVYGLAVVAIPTHRPCVRVDHEDVVFTHGEAKERAVLDEVARAHATGRPVLVGTASIEESERVAALLRDAGIGCEVLNARDDEREAEIIAEAGAMGAVTISTNMAGRGTDIRLGGAREAERDRVAALGGLYVIGTNRHESRRIDNQLRGRAGRQGDAGSSRFLISLEDDLIRRYGIDELLPRKWRGRRQEAPLTDPAVRREIDRAQRIVEGQNLEIRRTLWKYEGVLEQQRRIVRERREAVLQGTAESLLSEAAAERYEALRRRLGEAMVREVERELTLAVIDRAWADHLARVAELREQVHLASLGFQNPLDEFHRAAIASFETLLEQIDADSVEAFLAADVGERGIDLAREGLLGPSATWTYAVGDQPFGTPTQRLARGLRRVILDALGAG